MAAPASRIRSSPSLPGLRNENSTSKIQSDVVVLSEKGVYEHESVASFKREWKEAGYVLSPALAEIWFAKGVDVFDITSTLRAQIVPKKQKHNKE